MKPTEDTVHCPECGNDGALDGQGSSREFLRRVRMEDGVSREFKVTREWFGFHCPDCGCKFRTLTDENEEKLPGRRVKL